jgi:ribonucleoside-diphosphate reductase beta chain
MALPLESFPIKGMQRGRELAWDPQTIDLSNDRADWDALDEREKEIILGNVIGFLVGERAVAHDLAPLQLALRRERSRMHEEMYLTQQTYEESVHVEFFSRWMEEVLGDIPPEELPQLKGEGSPVIYKILPEAMNALLDDQSPKAQLTAAVVYHGIVEGVLAEVGYQVFYDSIDPKGILRGLREGLRNIQVDESRHIAFGTYLAQRIIQENPELESHFIEEMDKHLQVSLDSAQFNFVIFDDPYPFGLVEKKYTDLTRSLHERRKEAVIQGHLVEV